MKTALQILTEAITEYNQHVSPAYKFALTPKESEMFTDCFKEYAKQVAQKALEDNLRELSDYIENKEYNFLNGDLIAFANDIQFNIQQKIKSTS